MCLRKLIREFKKLRLRLQLKRHIKIELCVCFVMIPFWSVQNRRAFLSLDWYKWFSWFTVAGSCCRQNLKNEISRRRLADCVKNFHQKACRTCSTIIFPRSTNRIIALWRCRRFVNSLLFVNVNNCRTRKHYPIKLEALFVRTGQPDWKLLPVRSPWDGASISIIFLSYPFS